MPIVDKTLFANPTRQEEEGISRRHGVCRKMPRAELTQLPFFSSLCDVFFLPSSLSPASLAKARPPTLKMAHYLGDRLGTLINKRG